MIADPSPIPRDIGASAPLTDDRRHLRAFRGLVHELARLASRLEDSRHDSTAQTLTPAAAEILRQLVTRRTMPLASLRVGDAAPTPLQLGLLTSAGLIEVAPRDSETSALQVRLTATGEFQALLMDLPGLLRMARTSVGLTVEELDTTSRCLRALRAALDPSARTMRLVP
jgi:hypothetical protein